MTIRTAGPILLLSLLATACLDAGAAGPAAPSDWQPKPRPAPNAIPMLRVTVETEVVRKGWPVKIHVGLVSSQQHKTVTVSPPDWGSTLSVEIAPAGGQPRKVAATSLKLPESPTTLGEAEVSAVFLVRPEQTGLWPAGQVQVVATLSVPDGSSGWTGVVTSRPDEVTVVEDTGANAGSVAERHFTSIQYHHSRGDFAAMLAEADAWVQSEPDNFQPHVSRGSALEALGRDREALKALQRAAQLYWPRYDNSTLPHGFLQRLSKLEAKVRKLPADGGN